MNSKEKLLFQEIREYISSGGVDGDLKKEWLEGWSEGELNLLSENFNKYNNDSEREKIPVHWIPIYCMFEYLSSMKGDIKKCQRCQSICLEDNTFLWSRGNKKVNSVTQNSRVCIYVPDEYKYQCVNKNKTFDINESYPSHRGLDNKSKRVLSSLGVSKDVIIELDKLYESRN